MLKTFDLFYRQEMKELFEKYKEECIFKTKEDDDDNRCQAKYRTQFRDAWYIFSFERENEVCEHLNVKQLCLFSSNLPKGVDGAFAEAFSIYTDFIER